MQRIFSILYVIYMLFFFCNANMKILFLFQLKESEKTRKVMKKKRNFILIKLYNREKKQIINRLRRRRRRRKKF